jgi:hypothetical protein
VSKIPISEVAAFRETLPPKAYAILGLHCTTNDAIEDVVISSGSGGSIIPSLLMKALVIFCMAHGESSATSKMECGLHTMSRWNSYILMTRHHFHSSVITFNSTVMTFKGPLNVLRLKSNLVTDIIGLNPKNSSNVPRKGIKEMTTLEVNTENWSNAVSNVSG